MKKKWIVKNPDQQLVRRFYRRLKCHPVTATVLANRGFASEEDASKFMRPSLGDISSYSLLKDMDKAVERIASAIRNKEKILVFGDYDADGITSSFIVNEFLEQAGARVECYIPHRIDEGYGLRAFHIRDVAIPGGFGLIITTDSGSSSHDAVDSANAAGIDVVITDHHDMDELPGAYAVVNPKRADCAAGLEHLAGVGVAFFLLVCLRKHLRECGHWCAEHPEPNLKNACDLVAVGTIADVVPLLRENRVLARTGLDVINAAPRPAFKALSEICGLTKPLLDTGDLAFRIAPRLNAAGRMDHAMSAVNLLGTKDLATAGPLAESLHAFNAERRNLESRIHQRIKVFLREDPAALEKSSLVLSADDWHQGVIGIVASRLVEQFFRPVVLFNVTDGIGVGSARSIPGIDLHETLCACQSHLEAFGGHAMAAGLRIRRENIPGFRKAFDARIAATYDRSVFQPQLEIDARLDFDRISDQLADELQMLQPFGQDNPEPLFCADNIRVVYSKILGGRHRRMSLSQAGSKNGKSMPAICFNIDPSEPQPDYFERIAFRLQWNHYNGRRTLQLLVEETGAAE